MGQLFNSVTMNDPARQGHIVGIDSGSVNPLYQDEHFGEVEKRILKKSFMRSFLKIRPVRGTDTLTKPRMGYTPVQKLVRGVRAEDHSPTFDMTSIKVDTIILLRACEWTLEDFQHSFDVRSEIGQEQGNEIAKYFDEAALAQAVKACQITIQNPDGTLDGGWNDYTGKEPIIRTAPEGFKGGTVIMLDTPTAHTDPDLLERAFRRAKTKMLEKDLDIEDMRWLTPWSTQEVLSMHDKLISRDFVSGNGDYSRATVEYCGGIELVGTNRFPHTLHVRGVNDHYLSNASNGWSYNNSQTDIDCVSVLMHPKVLLAGETIPVMTKIYWEEKDKQWYIDAWTAFAITPDRAEYAAGIFKKQTGVTPKA